MFVTKLLQLLNNMVELRRCDACYLGWGRRHIYNRRLRRSRLNVRPEALLREALALVALVLALLTFSERHQSQPLKSRRRSLTAISSTFLFNSAIF